VEAGLKNKFLTSNLINEMVRDVCTSILNSSLRPNKRDRESVAKMIVQAYPFLGNPLINEETNAWVSKKIVCIN
jgi:hypothetical protein